MIARRASDYYRVAHPTAADAQLIIEVSDASLCKDKDVKLPLYAGHGVPEVWIVNLVNKSLEVYRQPSPSERRYRQVLTYAQGTVTPEQFPLVQVDVGLLF